MRIVAALLLLLCLVSGALAGEAVTVCTDGDGDHCPPSCTHCVCCSHAPAPGLLAGGGLAPVLRSERQEPAVAAEPSPGISPEILHVPRACGLSA
ncbi:MAG TPA: hypothetical protein VFV75_06215 [Candidatus Polarisedimenticolaceae bacterium]|nr:hypothetical protein [Candidatus Polarisedimenticolaceae bacterium]